MPNCVANDWSKMGDRDVFGYINRMQKVVVVGEWDVKHQQLSIRVPLTNPGRDAF